MAPFKMVFLDVDTQVDFMLPEGKLYVPGAEKIIPNLERLRRYAETQGVPVISSVDAHSPDDVEFQQFPPHCVQGTPGQQKLPQTLLPKRHVLPNENPPTPTSQPRSGCQQWILEKDNLDMFTNPQAEDLVGRLDAEQYVVYGVATEYCVKLAVMGLLQRGRTVGLVVDAIREMDAASGQAALQEMQARGAQLLETQQVITAALAA